MAEQPRYKKRVKALPEDIKIYIHNVHATDICNPISHYPIVRRVPPGSIYVTFEQCGESLYTNPAVEARLRTKNLEDTLAMKKPYENKARIAEIFQILNPDLIKIKGPGETYVVSQETPLCYWNTDDFRGIEISGVFEKSGIESLIGLAPIERKVGRVQYGVMVPAQQITMSKEQFLEYFHVSVYPTEAQVREVLNAIPGPNITSEMFEDINTAIEEKLGVFADSKPDGPDAFLSNRHIMEVFPGIHYVIGCRDVDEECEAHPEHVARRRAESEANEAARMANLALPNND